jgi:23S rRNA (guanosine2251-2'-O)-methyltransferase
MENEKRPSYRGSAYPSRPFKESKNIIFGIRPILEALQSGKELDTIFIQKGAGGSLMKELRDKLAENELPYQIVPIEKLNRLTQKVHQGAVAFLSQITYQRLDLLVPQIFEEGKVPLFMLLDRITDVRNFGAIARSCECLGVHGIIIPTKGGAQINEDAVKTSAGALLSIPVCRESILRDSVLFLRNSGLQIVACTEKASDILETAQFKGPTCIILGSEEDGVSDNLLRISDHLVRIPMLGTIESLNVSVSAGIILSEVQRQRRLA